MKPKNVWWLLALFETVACWMVWATFVLPKEAPKVLAWTADELPIWVMTTLPRVSRSGSSSPVSASSSSMLSSDMMVPFFLLGDPIPPLHGYRAAHAAVGETELRAASTNYGRLSGA